MFEATINKFHTNKAGRHPEHEERDLCSSVAPYLSTEVMETHQAESRHIQALARAATSDAVPFGGKVLTTIGGMGKVYDWRETGWAPANGGRIKPLLYVHHIPVVPNRSGIGDFITLRNVLVAQGLMVQGSTDAEGNVALYTWLNRLCYQARGANQFSVGFEHMHMTTSEPWTKQQMRAVAWTVNLVYDRHKVPVMKNAILSPGHGIVGVKQRGQTTHKAVAHYAGWNDRQDPGTGLDMEYVRHCVRFYRNHKTMTGA